MKNTIGYRKTTHLNYKNFNKDSPYLSIILHFNVCFV